jgi:hypothetical protein
MSSPLDRIQVLCEPDLYARIRTIAKARNQSLSSTAADLLAEVLNMEAYREEYRQAAETYGAVPAKEDKRIRPRGQRRFVVDHPVEGKGQAHKPEQTPDNVRSSYMDLVDQVSEEKLAKLRQLMDLLS